MSSRVVFVTGTDTGVGKTWVSAMLLRGLRAGGEKVCAYKPIASGCEWRDGAWINDDTEALHAAMGGAQAREQITPFMFPEAIAPHLAARLHGVELSVAKVVAAAPMQGDLLLVEGAGGWRVPLNAREGFSDVAVALDAGVVLVVALRLGCINHALLSAEAIRAEGLRLLGWVGNRPQAEAMSMEAENLDTLRALLPAPCLGVLPHGVSVEDRVAARADERNLAHALKVALQA